MRNSFLANGATKNLLVSADSIFIDTAKQLRRIYYFARVSLDNVLLRFLTFFFLLLSRNFPLPPFFIPDCAKSICEMNGLL